MPLVSNTVTVMSRRHVSLLRRVSSFLLAVLVAAGFRPPPAAGFDFSVSEERKVGEKLLSLVRKEFNLLDSPDITQYITGLGREVLKSAGPQFFDYHFFVIDSRELNAFAAPSGLIFIHSGLIEVMDHETELVSVVAHEAGHVASRHLAERFRKTAKVSAGTMALIIAGIAMGGGPLSEALITGSMAMGASLNLKFSRQDEEEADRLAYQWLREQGRNPAYMVDMLQELHNINRLRVGGNLPPYLQTHPEPGRRMSYVQDLLLFSSGGEYRQVDQFEFQRFKVRLRYLTREAAELLAYYQDQVAAGGKSSEMKHYGLALAFQKAADYERATGELRRVLRDMPDRPVLLTDLGVVRFEAGDYEGALSLFRRARQADQENDYTNYYLARALERTGRPDRALPLYEKLVERQPDFAALYDRLGRLKAELGETAAGFYYLGVYHWYQGDANRAERDLRRAVRDLPAGDPLRDKAREKLERIRSLEEDQ